MILLFTRRAVRLLLLAFPLILTTPVLARAHTQHGNHRTSGVAPSRAAGQVGSVPTIIQTLNSCGPASSAEVLAFWGVRRSQEQVQAAVRFVREFTANGGNTR